MHQSTNSAFDRNLAVVLWSDGGTELEIGLCKATMKRPRNIPLVMNVQLGRRFPNSSPFLPSTLPFALVISIHSFQSLFRALPCILRPYTFEISSG